MLNQSIPTRMLAKHIRAHLSQAHLSSTSVADSPVVYVKPCMHACVHMCVRAYLHVCLFARMSVGIFACMMHACMCARVRACVRAFEACLRAYMHGCAHAGTNGTLCMSLCMYVCLQACVRVGVNVCARRTKTSSVQVFIAAYRLHASEALPDR